MNEEQHRIEEAAKLEQSAARYPHSLAAWAVRVGGAEVRRVVDAARLQVAREILSQIDYRRWQYTDPRINAARDEARKALYRLAILMSARSWDLYNADQERREEKR